jgi:hypothetical protein
MAKFEEVSRHIIGGTEENYEEPQSSLLSSLYSNLESREYKPLIPVIIRLKDFLIITKNYNFFLDYEKT